jgi:hypothetical protein
VDGDGRHRNRSGWTWIQQDYDDLERFVAAAEYPIEWGAIGGQMTPVRSALACKHEATKKGMFVSQKDSDGIKPKTVLNWLQKDYLDLERLVDAADYTIDWPAIGLQMNPVRGGGACQTMASKRGIFVSQQDGGGDSHKRPRSGSAWLHQDYVDLERLVSSSESPINWSAIGGQMNPIRKADACQQMANKSGIFIIQQDVDGRKWLESGWTWIEQDYDTIYNLVDAADEPIDWGGIDWVDIGMKMTPFRGADDSREAVIEMMHYDWIVAPQTGWEESEVQRREKKRKLE